MDTIDSAIKTDVIASVVNEHLKPVPNFVKQHRREPSSGTTGDELFTTDDEEEYRQNPTYTNGVFHFDDDWNQANSSFSSTGESDDFDKDGQKIQRLAKKTSKPNVANKQELMRRLGAPNELSLKDKDKISWECLSSSDTSSESANFKDFADVDKYDVKEELVRLQEELKQTQADLRLRNEEVARLSRIRNDVEAEIEDLTASLFEEAHNMVREANINQAAASRSLKESEMKVEVLSAEVAALKALVLTSTPSSPNLHLMQGSASKTKKGHARSPSHFNLKYGRENSPPDSPTEEKRVFCMGGDGFNSKEGYEVDPSVYGEFATWKAAPSMDKSSKFLEKIYREDINLCLSFTNEELSGKLEGAVENGTVFIEEFHDKSSVPKKCALLEVPRICNYRIKFGDQDVWYNISHLCRNRITAVCNFMNYLRYIERGIVKSSDTDMYWEIVRLRKEMVLARLGLPLSIN